MRRVPRLLISLGLAVGCTSAPDATTLEDADRAIIASEPILDIGAANGPEPYQFFGVRAARLLDDGTLAVANAGSGEVRFYSSEGRYLRSVGTRGEGPGELEGLRDFWVTPGDTTIAFDAGDRTIVTYAPDGSLVEDRALQRVDGLASPDVVGRLVDGTFIVREAPSVRFRGAGKLSRDTSVLARYGADGSLIRRISTRPGRAMYGYETPGRVHMALLHFGAAPLEAVGDSVVYVHDGVSSTVDVLDPDGEIVGRLDLGVTPAAPSDQEIEAYRRTRLESARTPDQRRAVELSLETVPFAETRPTATWILAGSAGDVWVRRFRVDMAGPSNWMILRDGEVLGVGELPPGVTPLSLGAAGLVARWKDDLGVEHVRVYALTGIASR